MTLNDKLGNIMRGQHVMGCDGLATYHHIQAVKDAMRKREPFQRFTAIKAALKNYRVIVNFTGDDKARVFCPETKAALQKANAAWQKAYEAHYKRLYPESPWDGNTIFAGPFSHLGSVTV